MRIIQPIRFNVIKPIRFQVPILDDYGNPIGINISDSCKLYYDDGTEKEIRYDSVGRPMANLKLNEDGVRCYPLTRIALMSFTEEHHPYSYYKDYQVDHIKPTLPLDNHISNLEWVSRAENMRRAGETGVMIKKYRKPLIHKICQMTCDGYSRAEIKDALGVNGQLIDDVRSGRSHKSVSSLYIDRGFKYKEYDRSISDKKAEEVCKLLEKGYKTGEIIRELNDPFINHNFVYVVRNRIAHKKVSEKYNF